MKMKKLLASALAAAMVVSSMVGAMVTSAETTTVGTISAADVEKTYGETDNITAKITIAFNEGLTIKAPHNSVTVALDGYTLASISDPEVTYAADSADGKVTVEESNHTNGKILLEAPVDEHAPTVTKIEFDANFVDADEEDTAVGTYTIDVNGDDMTDYEEADIAVTDDDGVLTVIAAHVCTPAEAVVENNVDPTCTEAGSYDSVIYCSECGEVISRETITVEATDHTAAEAVVENNVDATCGAAGSYDSVVYCSVCNEEISRQTVTVDATGEHNYVDGICDVCGAEDPNYEPPVEECEHANATRTDITTATATELVFEYTCPDCGKVYPVTHTVYAATYSFGHTLEIQNDITLRFRVNKSALNGYSDIFTVFDKTEYLSGSPNTVRNIVSVDDVEYNSTRYVFAYTGIEAKMMNDSINAKLYAYKDGKYYCYAEDFSVVAYVNGVMPRTGASFPDSLKTALMDMVIYGSKAQDYFDDYNIDNLASDAIPTEYHTYATTPPRSEFAESNTVADFEGSIVTGWYRSLECLNKVVFNIRMAAPSTLEANNYKLKVVYKDVENADQTLWVDGSELVYKNNRWVYGFDKLAVMQFGESFTAVLCDLDGNPVSTTWTTSIEAYVKAVMGSDNMNAYPQDLRDMLVSMLTYGDSAKIYFESTNS